jgi:hypothetical protein
MVIFPGFEPESIIFNVHRVHEGTRYTKRDPLSVLTAFESGIDNVVTFLSDIMPDQLKKLAILMEEKHVTTDKKRVATMIEATKVATGGVAGAMFLFTDRKTLAAGNALSIGWQNGKGELVSLLD